MCVWLDLCLDKKLTLVIRCRLISVSLCFSLLTHTRTHTDIQDPERQKWLETCFLLPFLKNIFFLLLLCLRKFERRRRKRKKIEFKVRRDRVDVRRNDCGRRLLATVWFPDRNRSIRSRYARLRPVWLLWSADCCTNRSFWLYVSMCRRTKFHTRATLAVAIWWAPGGSCYSANPDPSSINCWGLDWVLGTALWVGRQRQSYGTASSLQRTGH